MVQHGSFIPLLHVDKDSQLLYAVSAFWFLTMFRVFRSFIVTCRGGIVPRFRVFEQFFVPLLLASTLTWAFWGCPVPTTLHHLYTGEKEDTGPPVGQWMARDDQSVRYQWYQFTDDDRIPVLECTEYTQSAKIQELLLPSLDDVAPIPDSRERRKMEPELIRELDTKRKSVVDARDRGLKRCALNNESEWLTLDTTMTFLTGDSQPSLFDTVTATPKRKELFSHSQVNHVLLARDGQRYFRVLAIQPVKEIIPSPTDATQYTTKITNKLRYVIVTEKMIIDTATAYLREIYDIARTRIDAYPCLCPAYFGILGSGIHMNFYGNNEKESANADPGLVLIMQYQRASQWELWFQPAMKTTQTVVWWETNVTLIDYLKTFPYKVNEKLNISRDRYEHVTTYNVPAYATVEYYNVADMLKNNEKVTLSRWLLNTNESVYNETSDRTTSAPLVQTFSLEDLSRGARSTTRIEDDVVTCYVHCNAIEQEIRIRAML